MKVAITSSSILLLALAAPASGTAQDAYYYYNGQRVPLTADPTVMMVHEPSGATGAGAQNTAKSLGVAANDVRFDSVPGWARVTTPGNDGGTRAKTTTLSQKSARFISPVLHKPDGSTMSPMREILVRYRDGRSPAVVFASLKTPGLISQAQIGQSGIWKITTNLRDGYAVLDLANRLAEHPDLTFASPDCILSVQAQFRPTDPNYGNSWGLRNTGQTVQRVSGGTSVRGLAGFDMQAEQAWDLTKGSSSVTVLVMDDGVDTGHPDLNLVASRNSLTGRAGGEHTGQYDGHGTMVAGCISAKNNTLGSCGIAPGVRVAAAKISVVKSSRGDFDLVPSAIVDALSWGHSIGARISNSSWGTANGNYGDTTIDNAFLTYNQRGMMHFVASGNGYPQARTIGWPASLPSVVAVGAASPGGTRADFSQFGAARGKNVDFLAPGDGIWTTDRRGSAGSASGDYLYVPGTSFASPYAAGVAALILSKYPTLTPSQIYSRMTGGCRDMGATGFDAEHGYGLINAYRALGGAAPVDDHPNTIATARSVSMPSTTSGRLELGGDVDFFKFTLTAAANINVRSQSSIDTVGEIYDSTGTLLGSNDDASGTRDFALAGTVNAGTYYVAVKGYNGGVTGAYSLVMTKTAATLPTMAVTGLNNAAVADGAATVSTTNGTDFGRVTTAGGKVRRTFTIRNTGTGALILSGSPLVAISGGGAGQFRVAILPSANIAAKGSTTFAIEYAPTASGSASATVSVTSNDTRTSPYQFTVAGNATLPAASDDHGDTLSTATVVRAAATAGRLERGGDLDCFKISVTGSGYLNIYTTGTTDTYGFIVTASGSILNIDDDSGDGTNFFTRTYMTTGTYYIVVQGYSGSTTGAYTLHVQ